MEEATTSRFAALTEDLNYTMHSVNPPRSNTESNGMGPRNVVVIGAQLDYPAHIVPTKSKFGIIVLI